MYKMLNTNTDALTIYLQDFYNNPKTIETYKINFIKNHYFPTINTILDCSFQDFKVGMSKHNNIIWFCNISNPDYHIMYDHSNNSYYIKDKSSNKPYLINIENYMLIKPKRLKKESKKINLFKTNTNEDFYSTCFMPCIIS